MHRKITVNENERHERDAVETRDRETERKCLQLVPVEYSVLHDPLLSLHRPFLPDHEESERQSPCPKGGVTTCHSLREGEGGREGETRC